MTWRRDYGPAPYSIGGDDSIYEQGSVYVNDAGEAMEVVYYAEKYADGTFGIREVNHSFSVDENGETIDDGSDEYEYEWGCALTYRDESIALKRVDQLAAADESWKFCE